MGSMTSSINKLEGYFDVYFPSCEETKKINTKIKWVQKQFVTKVYMNYLISYMT